MGDSGGTTQRLAGALARIMLIVAVSGCTATSQSSVPPSVLVASSTGGPSEPSGPSPTPIPVGGWSPVEIPGIDWLRTIAEHNGRLVALGGVVDGTPWTGMAFSDDGRTWTAIDPAVSGLGVGSVFGGELGFVAVAYGDQWDGLSVPTYLFSADGETWAVATPPANCVDGEVASGQFGFVMLGPLCGTEEQPPPDSLYVLSSADGRAWTSRLDHERMPGPWSTDGRRLLLLPGIASDQLASAWLTDDVALTWRFVEDPFPTNVTGYVQTPVWGHDRYLAAGTNFGGGPWPICVSQDGETWQCEAIGSGDAALYPFFVGARIVVTPTGYVSLFADYPPFDVEHGTTMVMATSTDGLHWTFTLVPDMANRMPAGVAWTAHGLFTWGTTNPSEDPATNAQPYIWVRSAPLP